MGRILKENGFRVEVFRENGLVGVKLLAYEGEKTVLHIPSVVQGYPVRQIGDDAFMGSEDLEKVVIPEYVLSIAGNAFAKCKNLAEVFIPDSVKKIGMNAFWGCEKLEQVLIPGSVTEIGGWAFENCSSLSFVQIRGPIEKISVSTFANCVNLNTVLLPRTIEWIGQEVFYRCPLSGIDLPDCLEKIGVRAFKACKALSMVTLPTGLKEIEAEAFSACDKLTKITIPASVDIIQEGAFMESVNLEKVIILGQPSIYERAFPHNTKKFYLEECLKFSFPGVPGQIEVYKASDGELYHKSGNYILEFLCIDEKDRVFWKDLDNTFFTGDFKTLYSYSPNNEAKEYVIPKHVEFIEDCAFLDNPYIEKIHLHENVQHAGEYAIANCVKVDKATKEAFKLLLIKTTKGV